MHYLEVPLLVLSSLTSTLTVGMTLVASRVTNDTHRTRNEKREQAGAHEQRTAMNVLRITHAINLP